MFLADHRLNVREIIKAFKHIEWLSARNWPLTRLCDNFDGIIDLDQSQLEQDFVPFQKLCYELLPHSLYSPNLTFSNYFLLTNLASITTKNDKFVYHEKSFFWECFGRVGVEWEVFDHFGETLDEGYGAQRRLHWEIKPFCLKPLFHSKSYGVFDPSTSIQFDSFSFGSFHADLHLYSLDFTQILGFNLWLYKVKLNFENFCYAWFDTILGAIFVYPKRFTYIYDFIISEVKTYWIFQKQISAAIKEIWNLWNLEE